jgi:hypothetical protein
VTRLVLVLVVVTVLSGCGGSSTPTGPADDYPAYARLAKVLGGKVISRKDAAARAAISCGQNGEALWERSRLSLRDSPTDLALVRAYCPRREHALERK